jgi:hypothetical protein
MPQILLQVQQMSSMPQQEQYRGLVDALRRIPQREGGIQVGWLCHCQYWQHKRPV